MIRSAVSATLVLSLTLYCTFDLAGQQNPPTNQLPGRPFSAERERAYAQQRAARNQAATPSPYQAYMPPQPPRTPEQIEASKRFAASLPFLIAKANAGDTGASYLVGKSYESGIGAPGGRPDMTQALHFYGLASQHGNLNAKYRLGYLMLCGISSNPNASPIANKQLGSAYMRGAVADGYDPATDKIVARAAPSAPRGTNADTGDNAIAALFAIAAIALVAAAASSGSGDGSNSSNTSEDLGTKPKYCMVPETVRNIDGSIAWQGQRAGYGYECP